MKGRVALHELVGFCLIRQERAELAICLRWPVGLVVIEHLFF
jgi:hypothetical protein